MTSLPNIIFLGADAVRADHTSLCGYVRKTTPSLDRLAAQSLVCDNAFSLAPFTQPASVQTFTSSRPLSYGGYDQGATGRPPTLFRHFRNAGYQTYALSTLHWVNRYFGYGDGLNVEHQLYTLNTVAGVAVAITRNSIAGYTAGDIPEKEMLDVVQPVFDRMFVDCIDYCEQRLVTEAADRADFGNSLLINAEYDFRKVRRILEKHQASFSNDPAGYIRTWFRTIPKSHEWLGREWYYCRKPMKLVSEALVRGGNALRRRFDANGAMIQANRFKQYVDAPALGNKVIDILRNHDRSRPMFLWAHFMDTHLPYVSGSGRKWWRETPRYLEATGHDPAIHPAVSFRPGLPANPKEWKELSALYDASILGVDEQIGRIADTVDELGMGENTIIAFCGDHGEELGEHGNHSHYFLPYEHNIGIPMLYRTPGREGSRIDGLTTLLDVAPTLSALAGISPDPAWEGRAVTDTSIAARDHVIVECFYGGNCLFGDRPIYVGVRTRTHKYFWKEYRDPKDWQSRDGDELYDIVADPDEQNNLYRPDHPLLPELQQFVANRLAEIPEVSHERIVRAFGETVAAAAA